MHYSIWKKSLLLALLLSTISTTIFAQLSDECKLDIGTNLGGMADFSREVAFVNVMRNARTWYSKDVGNPADPFSSGYHHEMTYRADGYPTHSPQTIAGASFPQMAVTIWAETDGWTAGQYTVLWEGTGSLQFVGAYSNLQQTSANRIIFDFNNPMNNFLEMRITSSDINDPVHNIRVLMPGTEFTYETQPFNPVWLNKLLAFDEVRFMDWGQTNNWGQGENDALDPTLFDWNDRSQMDYYTWAYEKGVPYEMMVKLMNDYDLDGWICVPHRASNDYLTQMAAYFRDNLETDRHLKVEYSNEIWNYIFGQYQWLNYHGCIQTGTSFPEGIVPYVQNCLDHFSTAYAGQLHRITRVVGAHLGWLDVSERIANNLTPGSFDAISPSCYFSFDTSADSALDALGSSATVADIAHYTRQAMPTNFSFIQEHSTFANNLGVELLFYEGGQHLTPHPFGQEPTYAQALLDIQRDTAMFNLYQEWFTYLRTVQVGDEPLNIMHFAFVAKRTAQYGSWGMLEYMNQDTNVILAPKYSAILANQAPTNCVSNNGGNNGGGNPAPDPCDVRSFIFGHSLLNHELQVNPTPSQETSVPHWWALLAEEAGNNYEVSGQYGFLPQHDDLPPIAQWGFDEATPAWDSDNEAFAAADFNNIIITAGNFIQWQAPDVPYYNSTDTPLNSTNTIIDWVWAQGDQPAIYIYENWPDMGGYLSNSGGSFPPNTTDFALYNNYVVNDFHDWWIDYHDLLMAAHPGKEVRMIPVGPILTGLFTQAPFNQIPVTELYEDDAPHGRATTYFLATLISYMATCETSAPATYNVPSIIHPVVQNNYATAVNYIWNELQAFNFPNGDSRVFFNSTALPTELVDFQAVKQQKEAQLTWTTTQEINNSHFEIEHSTDGRNFQKIGEIAGIMNSNTRQDYAFTHQHTTSNWNYYRLRQVDINGAFEYSGVRSVFFEKEEQLAGVFYPNPSANGLVHYDYFSENREKLQFRIFDIRGKEVGQEIRAVSVGENKLSFDFSHLSKGVYLVQIANSQAFRSDKMILK